MSQHQYTVMNLRGEKITGTVKVKLRPGFGVQGPDGNHLEGGPHDLPVAIAQQLIDTNRADPVFDEDVAQPEQRDPIVEQRDPRTIRRR
ncbi:MAG: hypothetical protein ACJ8AK_03050 [Gemmatimonadaceae bacterium]